MGSKGEIDALNHIVVATCLSAQTSSGVGHYRTDFMRRKFGGPKTINLGTINGRSWLKFVSLAPPVCAFYSAREVCIILANNENN